MVGLILWFNSVGASPPAPPAMPARPKPYRSTLKISNGGWGGDLVLSSTGDLQLSYDLPDDARATMERIQRVLNTNPRQWDGFGSVISRGDDQFHPDFGAGLPSQVDELPTEQLLTFVQGQVLKGLLGDSSISPSPPPLVIVRVLDSQTLEVSMTFSLVSGQVVTVAGSDAINLAVPGANLSS